MKQRTCRPNGEGLVMIIIVLAIIGIGAAWLFSHKNAMDRDARTFGREAIDQLVVKHDIAFFRDNLGPQGKLDNPPSQQAILNTQMMQAGVPTQPIKIEENVTFESHFFEPRGFFSAQLMYPSGAGKIELAVSHPVGKWQIDNCIFNPPKAH